MNNSQRIGWFVIIDRRFISAGSVWLALLFGLLWGAPAFALQAGLLCSDCHTMHNSQGGMAVSGFGNGPYNALLVTDCAGCHTGVNAAGSMPYVMSSIAPLYGATGTEAGTNTLAGGSFHWVAQAFGDSKGHNIVGLTAPDSILATPPGFDGLSAAADGSVPGGGSWPAGQQVTCAGTYGCHGSHSTMVQETAIYGGHHDDQTGAIATPGTNAADSYRMLVGVAGYEDPEWELTPTTTAHNQYKGVSQVTDNSTISSLCQRCHGEFHQQTGLDVWTQHPVDYDMADTDLDSEYRAYGGNGQTYQLAVPVASTSVNAPLATVTLLGGDAIVTCISCHRAHGSPYGKLLRWDYMGSNGTGCVTCHTSKN